MVALTVACCGGAVLYVRPFYDQYPSSSSPGVQVTGLSKVNDAARLKRARQLEGKVGDDSLDEDTFAQVYVDAANRQRRVTLVGATRFIWSPEDDLAAMFQRLGTVIAIKEIREVDAGPLGGEQRCAAASVDGQAHVLCAWADHGSTGIVLATGSAESTTAEQTRAVRAGVISR